MNNKRYCVIVIFIVIAIPIIILSKSSIGIFNEAESGAILGYCGAILGGVITFVGVLVTIKNVTANQKKDIKANFRPILKFEKLEKYESQDKLYSELYVGFKSDLFSDTSFTYLEEAILLKNVGRGEMNNVSVTGEFCRIRVESEESKYNFNEDSNLSYVLHSDTFHLVTPSETINLIVAIPNIINFSDSNVQCDISCRLKIEYQDLLVEEKEITYLHLSFRCNWSYSDKSEVFCEYIGGIVTPEKNPAVSKSRSGKYFRIYDEI